MDNLKEIICDNIYQTLSVDKNVRQNAEQQLNMLETNDDYGLHLMEISLSENIDFPIRHLAVVILNRYIAKHWCRSAALFDTPETSSTVKHLIRDFLLKSFIINENNENNQANIYKLLRLYAYCVSNIAQLDWSYEWPQIFPMLSHYLSSPSHSAVYTSLKVFNELSCEMSREQLIDISPILLPQIISIIIQNNYSNRIRTTALQIFETLLQIIMTLDKIQRNTVKDFLADYIPQFAEFALNILTTSETAKDICMKKDIISIITHLLKNCEKYMKPYLSRIMSSIWQILTTSANYYVKHKINSFNDEINDDSSELVDSDGESIDIDSYIYSIIDFVSSTYEIQKYRVLINPVLPELLYHILFYTQIPDEQLEKWKSNLNELIEEEDDCTTAFSVRIAAQGLLINLAEHMTTLEGKKDKQDDEVFKRAFLQAIQQHFAEATELEKIEHSNESQTWWKTVESCLNAIGTLAPTIIYTIKNEKTTSNEFKVILDNMLLNINPTHPFLAGRSLWTASRFSQIMNDQVLDNFLKLTSSLLNDPEVQLLRVYALFATCSFFENAQITNKNFVVKPHLYQFLQGLISIGMNCTNNHMLYMVFETIEILLKIDNEFTATISHSICSLSIYSVFRYPEDIIFNAILPVIDVLFTNKQAFCEAKSQLLPIIVSVLNGELNDEHLQLISNCKFNAQNLTLIQPQMLDILTKIVNRSNKFNDFIEPKVFSAVIDCIQKASNDDSAIFQNTSYCLTAFLKNDSKLLLQYLDPATNQNGVFVAYNICMKLLNPQLSDSAAAYAGRSIVMLILKHNQIIGKDNIQHLLRSTLVRLNTAKELLITQSLILVFAYIFYKDLPTILIFLNSLPAPDSTSSALEFVLNKWLGIQRFFYGFENKATTVALCRLFEHSLSQQQQANNNSTNNVNTNGDLSLINLHQIRVTCEDEYDDNSTMRTRSKSSKAAKRFVPCTVKILKLLISELEYINDLKEANLGIDDENFDIDEDEEDDDDDDENEDDGDDCEEIEEPGILKDSFNKSKMNELFCDEEELDDDYILCEEIANLNMENVLRTFLSEFKKLPIANNFFQHLTEKETKLLKEL